MFVFFQFLDVIYIAASWIEKPIFDQKISQGDVDQAFCELDHIFLHFHDMPFEAWL